MRHLIAILTLCCGLTLPAQAQQDTQLYHDLGEQAGIGKIVDAFVPLILGDQRLGSHFAHADKARLATQLKSQFCVLTGGPCIYEGKDMVSAHEGMHIRLAEFNFLAEDLQIAMEQAGVASDTALRFIGRLAPLQRAIVR